MVFIKCLDCGELIRLPEDAKGNAIQCLRCKSIIQVGEQPIGALVDSSGAETGLYLVEE